MSIEGAPQIPNSNEHEHGEGKTSVRSFMEWLTTTIGKEEVEEIVKEFAVRKIDTNILDVTDPDSADNVIGAILAIVDKRSPQEAYKKLKDISDKLK